MSDRASSDLPPPERSGETLWVVDVTAPLAPGRVRWVAGEAAARLQLPAEKLVALLENRIGPVTKPLPKASADRVAEVLDLAGAEVSIRAAGPADAGRTSTERGEARTPGASQGPSSAAPDPASMPDAAPAPRPVSEAPQEPAPEPASEPAPKPAPEPASAPDPEPAPAAEAPARTPAEPTTDDAGVAASVDAGSPAEVDAEGVRVRDQADVRDAGGQAAADEPAPHGVQDAPTTDGTAEEAEQRAADAQPVPPVGRPGTTGRGRDASDQDPWQSLGDDEDEAMLGAWTHRAVSAPFTPASTGTTESDPAVGAAQRDAPRAAPPAAAPGGRPPSAAAPAFEPSEPPHVVVDRDEDDDEDEGWTYGLRDPFAEAERRERAVRRWALAASLLVALGIFLVLQWAYSRPGPDERTPPPYAVGLTAYRDGAFVSAARAWAPRAEAGDVEAMFMLGWMAEYGQGRPWSNREAAGWYAQAAQRGHAPSQLRLADLYAQGLGVAFDPDLATRWYLAAAQAGLPRAQREAALAMAREGRHAEAAAWLDSAAAHDPDAAAWLALMDAARTLNLRSE